MAKWRKTSFFEILFWWGCWSESLEIFDHSASFLCASAGPTLGPSLGRSSQQGSVVRCGQPWEPCAVVYISIQFIHSAFSDTLVSARIRNCFQLTFRCNYPWDETMIWSESQRVNWFKKNSNSGILQWEHPVLVEPYEVFGTLWPLEVQLNRKLAEISEEKSLDFPGFLQLMQCLVFQKTKFDRVF